MSIQNLDSITVHFCYWIMLPLFLVNRVDNHVTSLDMYLRAQKGNLFFPIFVAPGRDNLSPRDRCLYKPYGFFQLPRILNKFSCLVGFVWPSDACSMSSTTREYSSTKGSWDRMWDCEVIIEDRCFVFFFLNNWFIM